MTPREQWTAALRSGNYPQGTGQLRGDEGFCCLGVACELAVEAGVIFLYTGSNGLPPREVQDWLGLCSADGTFLGGTLTECNDNFGLDFERIATIIETHDEMFHDDATR